MALKTLKEVSWETEHHAWRGSPDGLVSKTLSKVFLKESPHFQGKLARYMRTFKLRPASFYTELPVEDPNCLRRKQAEWNSPSVATVKSGDLLLLTGRVIVIETTYNAENIGKLPLIIGGKLAASPRDPRTYKEWLLEVLHKEHRVFVARHQIDLKKLVTAGYSAPAI